MRRSSPLPPSEPDAAPDRGPSGVWAIDGDTLVTVEHFDVGPAIVLVPSEDVLMLAVDLPIASARGRLDALPFAIEDRIAQPLGDIHGAIGSDLGGQRYLAGIVGRERMATWSALLDGYGLDRAALVPDVLGLPVPPPGAWSVERAGDRLLVRADDGTGFGLPVAHFAAAWAAAGKPRLIGYGEPLSADMPCESGEHAGTSWSSPALDLRQGAFARRRRMVSPVWRRIAIVAAAGVAAHAAIVGAETLALEHIASARAAETRAIVQQVAPNAVIGDDVAASVADILPASGPGPSIFLPLFGRVAGALKPLGTGIRMRSLAYDAAAGTMSVEIEAATIDALQQAGAALSSAGLSAQAGAASQSEGKAVGAFLIRGAA